MKHRWRAFQINEVDTIAAKSRQQAIEFYMSLYGMDREDVIECYERSLKGKMYCNADAVYIRKAKIYTVHWDKCYKITLGRAIKKLSKYDGHKAFLLCSTEW